jgi:hypothetical protein
LSIRATVSTWSGSRARNAGVNQRGTTMSASGAMPCERTSAARSCQACAFGIGVRAAQQTASEVTRSGALAASQMPVMPPSDTPANANRSMP